MLRLERSQIQILVRVKVRFFRGLKIHLSMTTSAMLVSSAELLVSAKPVYMDFRRAYNSCHQQSIPPNHPTIAFSE